MKYDWMKKTAGYVLFIIVWSLMATVIHNKLLFAGPVTTLITLVHLGMQAGFWKIILFSFLRILTGLLLGFAVGGLCAAGSFRFHVLEALFAPFVTLFKTVPVVCFVVLLLIWQGADYLSVIICFLIVFPNVYIQFLEGLKSVPKDMLEMSKVLGFSKKATFFGVYRPALKPFVYSCLRLVLGLCWKSGVAAEVIGTPDVSIGEQLYMSKIYLDTASVFAWTLVIVLLSIWFEKAVLCIVASFFEWQPELKKTKKREGNTSVFCKHLTKTFVQQKLLENFDFECGPGETKTLTWPSGTGKTTFFRILTGLDKEYEGDVSGCTKCAMMFQEDRLCMDYCAIDNVNFVVGNKEKSKRALQNLLEESKLTLPCKELSGGERRRVALVRAMESEEKIIILDEPYTGMDEKTIQLAKEYIEKKQDGRALLIATHI